MINDRICTCMLLKLWKCEKMIKSSQKKYDLWVHYFWDKSFLQLPHLRFHKASVPNFLTFLLIITYLLMIRNSICNLDEICNDEKL